MKRLPSLRTGITLLDADRRSGALQSLVVNHLIMYGGDARWIDAHGHASTVTMHRVVPEGSFLDRINVARAFTAHQHFGLLEDVLVDLQRRDAVLVVPELDYFVVTDDIVDGEGEQMLVTMLRQLDEVVQRYEIPVLISTYSDAFEDVIDSFTDHRITCSLTGMGARFSTDAFETLVYPGNGYVQTTLKLFEQVLKEQYLITKRKQRRVRRHG